MTSKQPTVEQDAAAVEVLRVLLMNWAERHLLAGFTALQISSALAWAGGESQASIGAGLAEALFIVSTAHAHYQETHHG